MPARSLLPVSLLLGVMSATALAGPLLTRPANAVELNCAAPQPGRYVVMGQGQASGEPVARILQETWTADGSLQGVRMERRGSRYAETTYTGNVRAISNCRASITRSYGTATSPSQVVLDPQGRPRFSLGTLPDVLLISRWYQQPERRCEASLLDGSVVSMQTGHSRKGQLWQPNAVVQHEEWRQGLVKGIAVSSYGPSIEESTYKGSITVNPDCLATVKEVDSLGTTYNYRAVVLADRSGYIYLQTDPDNLTIGSLERIQGQ
ncbi:MAG: hypothetical protein WCH37_09035 [Synechococcaceae cyanobacterium ELA182]